LRSELTAERAHLVLEQVALRERARKKFSAAERLFFTPLSLEQATDQWIAAHKALRFAVDRPVVDFCCGIGGDLMALAASRPVLGVDRDPVATLLAKANAERCASAGRWADCRATFEDADVDSRFIGADDSWHIDPDRRPGGRRTTQAELHDPPAAAIDRLRAISGDAAIKLAPGAAPPANWCAEAELEWISFARECRQLVAWFGRLAELPGQRRATLVDRESGALRSITGLAALEVPVAEAIGRYLLEPDAAILAADLTGALARVLGLAAVSPGAAYLTADAPSDDPAVAVFEVLEALPFDARRLKKMLRERRIGRLEVKKRGVPVDPQAVARDLRVPGDERATLLLTRREKSVVAILARRVER
jgi:hypothetical protein